MDIKHALSRNVLEPAYVQRAHATAIDPGPLDWVEVGGDVAAIGHAGDGFAFDNEQPRHDVIVRPFRLADRLITCGEWLEFMADGGYRRAELWLSDGWSRRLEEGWEAPLYWRPVRRWLAGSHAPRHAARRPPRAGVPRQLLRSRRLRDVGRQAAADRVRVGARRRRPRGGGGVPRLREPPSHRSGGADG